VKSGFLASFSMPSVEDREDEGAIVPVEGFFLPPASVKAQKVAKGKRRNGTSIAEYRYLSRKQSMRHGND